MTVTASHRPAHASQPERKPRRWRLVFVIIAAVLGVSIFAALLAYNAPVTPNSVTIQQPQQGPAPEAPAPEEPAEYGPAPSEPPLFKGSHPKKCDSKSDNGYTIDVKDSSKDIVAVLRIDKFEQRSLICSEVALAGKYAGQTAKAISLILYNGKVRDKSTPRNSSEAGPVWVPVNECPIIDLSIRPAKGGLIEKRMEVCHGY